MARRRARQLEHVVEIPDDPRLDPEEAGIEPADYDLPWFVVMTAPNAEFFAQHRLRERGYRTWLPYVKVRRLRKVPLRPLQKAYTERKAYFPTYLFARVGSNQDIAGINNCDHVSSVVYAGLSPLAVPASVVRSLVAMGDSRGLVGAKDVVVLPEWPSGAKVRFRENTPFAGWAATVEFDRGGDVKVFLETVNHALTVRAGSLEPA